MAGEDKDTSAVVTSTLDDASEETEDTVAGGVLGNSEFPCGKGEELDVDKVGVVASGELTDATAVCEAVADRHGTRAGQGVPEPYPVPRSRPRSRGGDILGPFPITLGQRKFMLVAIDYFTKWVEVEPLANITT